MNLIGNAIKFTEQGSGNALACGWSKRESDNPKMEFAVTDTGIGMTPEPVGRLFQPFSQADASTSRRYRRHGPGADDLQADLDQLGGEILVESEYGKGSVFRAIVPIGSLAGVRTTTLALAAAALHREQVAESRAAGWTRLPHPVGRGRRRTISGCLPLC